MPPEALRGRVHLHHVCIGARNETLGASMTEWSGAKTERTFLDWPSLLQSIGLDQPPDFLKVDIEGFEYGVRSMLHI